jgi:hypothetical protein
MARREMTPDTERRRSRYHRSLSRVMGGLILLVLGTLLLLANQGVLDWGGWWQYFLIGLGGVFIIDWAIRYLTGERTIFSGKLIAGIILIGVGAIFLTGVSVFWPVILIVVGMVVLLAGLLRRRR